MEKEQRRGREEGCPGKNPRLALKRSSEERRIMKRSGFTLIELLIVVAIIGILAAIAVPNFLNAQLRARVVQVYSDQRALAQGFDMYGLDNNGRYPFRGGGEWQSNVIYPMLTTPIPYMNSIPLDQFTIKDQPQRAAHGHYYPAWNVLEVAKAQGWQPGWGGVPMLDAVKQGAHILMVSSGPDKHEDIASNGSLFAYHTSNGLGSEGDIYRFTPGTLGQSM